MLYNHVFVAPYVGAWIETGELSEQDRSAPQSHPTWVRGLKPLRFMLIWLLDVAPYVGAWIETP